jgi:putative cardiolipin synthase
VLWSLHEAAHINRRMHNKLFIADNSFAIVGGRNIANEYFDRSQPANFIDLDTLVAGPAVQELSDSFDAYWNGPLSYPIEDIATVRSEPSSARARFTALMRGTSNFQFAAAGSHDARGREAAGAQLLHGGIALQPARVRVVADAVERVGLATVDTSSRVGAVMNANLELFKSARAEVLVVSPYVVPMPRMTEALQQAGRAGARVSVVTNSLATTDEPLAHFGYARHRAALLKMGVALYELMPERKTAHAANDDGHLGSLGRLHAKLAVVDRRWFYVGSMNMDRRSAHCNTELGLVAESPALAGELADLIHREHMSTSFSVSEADGATSLRWRVSREGRATVFETEPDSSWGQLLWGTVLAWWIGEEWL